VQQQAWQPAEVRMSMLVLDIPEKTVNRADTEALRGWGMLLPGPAGEEWESDSVDKLEAYLHGEVTTVQDWVDHCLPWAAR